VNVIIVIVLQSKPLAVGCCQYTCKYENAFYIMENNV